MKSIRNSGWAFILFIGFMVVLTLPMLSSCGKAGNINTTEAKIEYQVLNLSYDILPVNLYINLLKQNTSPFTYPSASGYIGLTTIDTPFQIRSTAIATINNLLKIKETNLSRRTKYSLFITGSRKANNLTYIFTVDTSTTPALGRGKVRFVNAAMDVDGTETGLTLTANETEVFSKIKYKEIGDYTEMKAGIYDFRISPSKNPANTLKSLLRTTIEDGRLYTIYTYGLAFRTDTTAFGTGLLTNR